MDRAPQILSKARESLAALSAFVDEHGDALMWAEAKAQFSLDREAIINATAAGKVEVIYVFRTPLFSSRDLEKLREENTSIRPRQRRQKAVAANGLSFSFADRITKGGARAAQ